MATYVVNVDSLGIAVDAPRPGDPQIARTLVGGTKVSDLSPEAVERGRSTMILRHYTTIDPARPDRVRILARMEPALLTEAEASASPPGTPVGGWATGPELVVESAPGVEMLAPLAPSTSSIPTRSR